MSGPGKLIGQVPQRLRRPPQRRHRVASLVGLHQMQQRRNQVRIQLRRRLTTPARAARPADRHRRIRRFQLTDPRTHRRLAHRRRQRHRANTTVTDQPGLRAQRQPLLPFIQVRQQHGEATGKLITPQRVDGHNTSSATHSEKHKLFRYTPTSLRMCLLGCRSRLTRRPCGRCRTSTTPRTATWPEWRRRRSPSTTAPSSPRPSPKSSTTWTCCWSSTTSPPSIGHLRTTNPIESTFATVRHRTKGHQRPWIPRRRPGDGIQAHRSRASPVAGSQRTAARRPRPCRRDIPPRQARRTTRRLRRCAGRLKIFIHKSLLLLVVTRRTGHRLLHAVRYHGPE